MEDLNLDLEPSGPKPLTLTQEQLDAMIAAAVAKATAKAPKVNPEPKFGVSLDKYGNTQFSLTYPNGFSIRLGTPLAVGRLFQHKKVVLEWFQTVAGINPETASDADLQKTLREKNLSQAPKRK